MVSLSRASKAAAILAVCGLGLGACSTHPGTAAIIGDWSVSEAELDLSSQQLSALMGQQVDAAQFLPDMSSSRAVGQVAEENGVTVSDEEVMQQFQQMGERCCPWRTEHSCRRTDSLLEDDRQGHFGSAKAAFNGIFLRKIAGAEQSDFADYAVNEG